MHDDDVGFRSLTRTIAISLDAYKSPCIKRRIATRMRACGVRTFHDYEAVLSERPDEWARLEAALTINVTSFYRNPETWRQLESVVLPELFVARQGRVRVWSAGCASGEEPYTLAILLAFALTPPTSMSRVSLGPGVRGIRRPPLKTPRPRGSVTTYARLTRTLP